MSDRVVSVCAGKNTPFPVTIGGLNYADECFRSSIPDFPVFSLYSIQLFYRSIAF